jgi:hypothetical protein
MDANAGVFEAILGEDDVMIADRLIHASIIDGIRLCKAQSTTPTSTCRHEAPGEEAPAAPGRGSG